jgi:hypothetical protein
MGKVVGDVEIYSRSTMAKDDLEKDYRLGRI